LKIKEGFEIKGMTEKITIWTIISICASCITSLSWGQFEWPKVITATDGTIINIYQPQPDFFSGNTLKSQSAISISKKGVQDPIFGVFWSTDRVETDRDTREVAIESVKITDLKIPDDTGHAEMEFIKATLESFIPRVAGEMPLDEVVASLDQDIEATKLSNDISNQLPKVIYTNQQSMLVLIDGAPRLQKNKDWGTNVVINSPFTIVENKDGKFYLYGGSHWYSAVSATGPYSYTGDKVPRKLRKIARSLQKNARKNNYLANGVIGDHLIYSIIVSTAPAVLIQSQGNPDLVPIEGTSLLYVKNSDNDIFVDTYSQQYYVLLSGRWYKAKALSANSQWEYVAADKLPADFARIPEGSPKDNVLASVAGTDAAIEAVKDAQIPQTARVDRNTTKAHISYDGIPQFKAIKGTHMQYAINANSTVLLSNGKYYAVDNGIWFIADGPYGPWAVSIGRPDEIDEIPPTSPVYNAKYVYVYDSTPDYVNTGYTSGYLNSFIDGSTVVYGTGYNYDPWIGAEYYPEPWTWGFDMDYSPWCGWGLGLGYDFDWFNMDFGYGWNGWNGGWWGPSFYRPAYRSWGARYHGGNRGGYYGRNASIERSNHMDMRYANNIYRNREGVIARNSGTASNFNNRVLSPGNTIFSDRQGNIYQRGSQGQWQQRANRQWSSVNNARSSVTRNLNRQQQMRERGQVRSQNFQRASSFSGMRFGGGGGFRSGGGFSGGARSSGGGFSGAGRR
jgi:hypothetical protein